MSSVSSANLQLLVNDSLVSSSQAQLLANATPRQLEKIVAGNSALIEDQVLLGLQPSATSAAPPADPTSALLTSALQSSLTPSSGAPPSVNLLA